MTARHFIPAAGRAMSEPDYQAWARQHCVTQGARAGGGTPELKQRATADLLGFPARPRLRASMDESCRFTLYLRCDSSSLSRRLFWRSSFPSSGRFPSSADELLWVGSDAGQVRAEALLKAIRGAADHGLEPAWYGVGEVEKALAPGADPAATETLLTAAFVAYASDVSTGRVRANRVDKDIDIQQRKVERADLLKAAADGRRFRRLPRRACRPRATIRPCRRRWRRGATSAPRPRSRRCPTAAC